MFWPLGHHGIGLRFERQRVRACRLPDRQGGRGFATRGHVHLFQSSHLHGVFCGGLYGLTSSCCRTLCPAIPRGKLHWTGIEFTQVWSTYCSPSISVWSSNCIITFYQKIYYKMHCRLGETSFKKDITFS